MDNVGSLRYSVGGGVFQATRADTVKARRHVPGMTAGPQRGHTSCPLAAALGHLVHHRHRFSLALSDRSEASGHPPTDASDRPGDVIDTAAEYNTGTLRYAQPRAKSATRPW